MISFIHLRYKFLRNTVWVYQSGIQSAVSLPSMLPLQDSVPHIYLYVRGKDCFSLKTWITVDSSECRKNLLSYNPVPCHRRGEVICFVSKEIFGFIFKLLFVFALSVEQISKVKMKDVLLMSFQCQEGVCLICLKMLNIGFSESWFCGGFVAEVSEIRTGPILSIFLIPLFVFVDSSVEFR